MDLFAKVVIAAVIMGVILGAFFLLKYTYSAPLTQAQAEQVVLNDLKAHSPGAIINVINVSSSNLRNDSWKIVVNMVYNSTRPCPTILTESFDYPALGLSPTVYSVYSDNCNVYGGGSLPGSYNYVIGSPYIAIAQSYAQNYTQVKDYVSNYGYNATSVHAKFYDTIPANFTPLNKNFSNSWLINYTASGATQSLFVIMSANGIITNSYTENS